MPALQNQLSATVTATLALFCDFENIAPWACRDSKYADFDAMRLTVVRSCSSRAASW